MEHVSAGSMRDASATIAEDINWTVNEKDYWVIAGLQGSGKSDLLLMTGGLMAPKSGDYSLFGERMPIFDEARLRHRLRLGLVFDGGQLFNHLTVRENIALPLRYHQNLSSGEAKEQVDALLEVTELSPYSDTTPGTLGRNWQKRVGLARALILKPEVLLIDNPLGGLDLRHTQWWLRLLELLCEGVPRINTPPMTLVATTSDLRPWQGRARQFAVLRNRRFTILGQWSEVEKAGEELLSEVLVTESARSTGS
jgi:ABC-type transporter Mla maintaining outer membrane lipid asymmetry ATPase subunit MlaF